MFTIGQIGALLYLWSEPKPLLMPSSRSPARACPSTCPQGASAACSLSPRRSSYARVLGCALL